MNVREYIDEDYETVAEWWQQYHGTDFMPPQYLPHLGYIAECDGKMTAALFIYDPQVPICMLNFPVCNPSAGVKSKRKGLESIVRHVQGFIVQGGIVAAFPYSRGLTKIFKDCGFKMVNEYNKEMVWGAY